MEEVLHCRWEFPFGGLVPFWHRDVPSVESNRRLTDLSLAIVYILLPRPRMRSAHIFRGRGLHQTSFSYFLEIWTQAALWLYLRYLSNVCKPRFWWILVFV